MTRVLLVGKNGQIGWELFRTLQSVADVTATERSDLDVRSKRDVFHVFETVKPDVVINATGYNDVDGAEVNRDDAFSVNVAANEYMSTAACKIKALYITYSTDYVFDGLKGTPYVESDPPAPLNVYGQTKLDGEAVIVNSGANYLILRTSSVYSIRRPCFLSNFLKRAKEAGQLQVRADLVSSPTSAGYLAEITTRIVSFNKAKSLRWLTERNGIYHLAGSGIVSRFGWAQQICEILKLNVELVPFAHVDYNFGATRPVYTPLDSSSFFGKFGLRPVSWEKMLKTTLNGLL